MWRAQVVMNTPTPTDRCKSHRFPAEIISHGIWLYYRFCLSYVPRVLITDQLKSYAAVKREVMASVEHRQSRYLNNRWENSHRPTRECERRMQRFKSPGHAQRFLSAYGSIAQHFRPRRHLLSASAYRDEMRNRFERWAEITGTERAA